MRETKVAIAEVEARRLHSELQHVTAELSTLKNQVLFGFVCCFVILPAFWFFSLLSGVIAAIALFIL